VITAGLLRGAKCLAGVRFVEALRFPAEEVSPDARVNVREVRAYLCEVLDGAGVDLGDVDLMASEVVTNAVRHTASGRPGGHVWVAVVAADDAVRVEITDEGGVDTQPCIPPYPVLGGRGLLIVQELDATPAAVADRRRGAEPGASSRTVGRGGGKSRLRSGARVVGPQSFPRRRVHLGVGLRLRP
jgi:anti-sigma regulatory factor (Ser/Thr protein kinase)